LRRCKSFQHHMILIRFAPCTSILQTTHQTSIFRYNGYISHGLTSWLALHRLEQDGSNQLCSAPRQPAWRCVLSHFQDPLMYMLLAAVFIALDGWMIEGMTGWPVDAIAISTLVLLHSVLGYVQEAKAEGALPF
jgi:P-type Ca2+ transporter type 2C